MARQQIPISFNKYNIDVYEYLKNMDNRSDYIINLVRRDMNKSSKDDDSISVSKDYIKDILKECLSDLNLETKKAAESNPIIESENELAIDILVQENDNEDDEF